MWYDKSMEFWVGVVAAIIVKLRTSEKLTPTGAFFIFCGSLASAIAFSGWVSSSFNLPLELAGAITALLADTVMRGLLALLDNPDSLKEFILYFLGRGSK